MPSDFIIYKQNAIARALDPDSADSDKEGYVDRIRDLKVNIQVAGPEYEALTPVGDAGKLYLGYTTTSGIKEGMMIVTSGTTTISGMRLKVLGVEEWRGPLGRHYELRLLKPAE